MKKFAVLFEQEKDEGYSVSVPSLPGCFSQGDTFEKALKNIQEAIDLYLEDEEIPEAPIKEFLVPVYVVVKLIGQGQTFDQIQKDYPQLTQEDIKAAIDLY